MPPHNVGKHPRLQLFIESSWRFGTAIVLALIVDWLIGTTLLFLSLVLAVYSGWSLYNLYRAERWLRLDKRMREPDAMGVWEDIFLRISRIKLKHRQDKHAMMALLRRFRDAADALPDGVLALSEDHRLLWFNRAARRFLGLHQPVDLGQRIGNLVRVPAFTRWLAARPESEPLELPVGRSQPRILRFSLVRFAHNDCLVTFRNITERRRLEEMRRDFVANVSHELRTPLTVITGYLDLLQEDAADEQHLPLREMQTQAERMSKLVDDLLTLARHERNEDPAALEPLDMRALQDSLQSDASAISQGRHQLHFDFRDGLILLADRDGITSAFSNLISNAIRYTDEKGSIRISWQPVADGGVFEVTDSGSGIAAHHIPRLTERFYRVSVHRSRSSGGTGLGLAIVKHVLRQHDARLEIQSVPGEGSAFRCQFPPKRITRVQAPAPVEALVSDP